MTFIDGEVLGVPVDTGQLLVLPTDPETDDLTVLMMSGENDDTDGDGIPDEDILVTGERPRTVYEDPNGDGTSPGDDTGGGGGGGGGGGFTPPPAEDEEQDCTDRKALAAKDDIRNDNNSDTKEHAVVIYRGADGAIHKSTPIEGDANGYIQVSAIRAWMEANNVSFAQVTGWVHNHDNYHYGVDGEWGSLNRYPSGGSGVAGTDADGGDWNASDWFVNNGANASTFSIYIVAPDWGMREFHYADKAYWARLDKDDRERGVGLPDAMVSDGSSC